jgi:hypothetical protein
MVSFNQAGDWVQGSEKFLRPVKKATGGGSAIARGKIVFLDESTGIWAVAGTGGAIYTRKGVCVATNADSDATFVIGTGGGTYYVTSDGVIKPDSPVEASTTNAGNVMALSASGTYAANIGRELIGYYKGHADEGDGSGQHPATDAAATDLVKVEITA